MNRGDLHKLSNTRLREAQALFAAGEFSGAYYLAGYAVECALKACFAKSVQRYDFPTKKNLFIHNLSELSKLTGIDADLLAKRQNSPRFAAGWDLVCRWNEHSRYAVWSQADAEAIIDAIVRRKDGVLPWIRQRW